MGNDLKWAIRILTRRRGFAAVFVSILGATLAISLTIGTVARATTGAALPYNDEDALITLSESNVSQAIDRMESSLSSVEDWRERSRSFDAIGAVRSQLNLTLRLPDGVVRLAGALVTRSMFEVLGVNPILGRAFNREEDTPGAGIRSVILGYGTWRDRFGEDRAVLGRTLVINGSPWTVVGVLPENQSLAPHRVQAVDLWLPVGTAGDLDGPAVYSNRLYRMYSIIGRARSGATSVDLDRDLTTLTAGLAADYPDSHEGWEWNAEPLRDRVLAGIRTPITALLVGGLLLFAVAVVNLLALYIQRIRAQHGQMATRLAIGARPADLVRLGLVELAVLGVVSGVAGTGLSAAAVAGLTYWLPVDLPVHAAVTFDWRIGLVGIGVAVGSLVLVGLAGMSVALRGLDGPGAAGGRIAGSTRGASRASRISLGAQVALSTFLAIGSAIAVRSFIQLSRSDPGIDPERLVTLRVDVPAEMRDPAGVLTAADDILLGIAALPGVERAFLWSPHVPTEATWYTRVRLFDRPDVPEAELPTVRINTVGSGAVTDIGLAIVAGRDLTGFDRQSGRRVVLVSASAARAWWGNESAAVGRTLRRWNHEEWSEVVGVVEDAPLSGRQGQGADFFNDVYFLFGQDAQRDLVFFARTRPGVALTAQAIQTAVQSAAPDLTAWDIRSMDARLARQDALARSSALLSSLFAATAVALAALGLYGGLSFVVSRKRKEISVRRALGATPGRVMRELMASAAVVVGAGTIAGVVLAWFGLQPLDGTLFAVGSRDLPGYVAALTILLMAASVALLIPSLRVLRASPGESLRAER